MKKLKDMNFDKPQPLLKSTTARLRTALFHFKIAFNNFVIGCRIPQFLRSTKVVLIKFCAVGIVQRLFIPYCLIWILTGKFYCGKICTWMYGETILFELWKMLP